MFIDGMNFNSKWVANQSLEAFLTECNQPGYLHLYGSDPNRVQKLSNVHALCCKAEGVTHEEKPARRRRR